MSIAIIATQAPHFHRVAEGHYETPDGHFMLYRLRDLRPAAWNIEDIGTGGDGEILIVDGAATKRDALAIFAEWWEGFA